MAKKVNPESLINVELEKLENKVQEFQTYLEENPITSIVTKEGKFILAEKEQGQLHSEIAMQIKMQYALFDWLPLLEKLREKSNEKKLETRGDINIGGMFKK